MSLKDFGEIFTLPLKSMIPPWFFYVSVKEFNVIPGFHEANLCFKVRNLSKTYSKTSFETKFLENTFWVHVKVYT